MLKNKIKPYLNPKNYKEEVNNKFVRNWRRKFVTQIAVRTIGKAAIDQLTKEDDWLRSKWKNKPFIGPVLHYLRKHLLSSYGRAIEGSQVVTLEEAYEIIDIAEYIVRKPCMCREVFQADRKGICLTLGLLANAEFNYSNEDHSRVEITKKEAKEILKDCHLKGFVHMSDHCFKPYRYALCSCSYPACVPFKFALAYGIYGWVRKGSYNADHNLQTCTACGNCKARCNFLAVSKENGYYNVDKNKCFGCGACVVTCKSRSINLVERKKEEGYYLKEPVYKYNKNVNVEIDLNKCTDPNGCRKCLNICKHAIFGLIEEKETLTQKEIEKMLKENLNPQDILRLRNGNGNGNGNGSHVSKNDTDRFQLYVVAQGLCEFPDCKDCLDVCDKDAITITVSDDIQN